MRLREGSLARLQVRPLIVELLRPSPQLRLERGELAPRLVVLARGLGAPVEVRLAFVELRAQRVQLLLLVPQARFDLLVLAPR